MTTRTMHLVAWLALATTCAFGASSVPFSDNFESYPEDTTFLIETNGWLANTNTVIVQTNVVSGGLQAVDIPAEGMLSNAVNGAGIDKLWADQVVRPVLGPAPAGAAGSTESVRLYFDEDGYVVIATNGGWDVCSTDTHGGAVAKATSGWVRVAIHHDFVASNAAVVLRGQVLREEVPFIGSAATAYTQLRYDNTTDGGVNPSNSYVDDVSVTIALPTGFATADDGDVDGVADANEIHLYGNTTTNNTGLVAQGLPFEDDFEFYLETARLTQLGYYGWAASSDSVIVQTNEVNGGDKAVLLSTGTSASNSLDTAERRTWTDWYVVPTAGVAPEDAIDAGESLRFYVNTNGYIAIATNGGWDVCTHDVFNVAVAPLSNDWVRLTVHHNYGGKLAAVLLNGRVLREEIPFIGASATNYTSIVLRNPHTATNAYVDDVLIATNQPAGLDEDGDNDGMDDADELDTYGNTTNYHLPYVQMTITNVSSPAGDGGTVIPTGKTEYQPGSDTNYVISAYPAFVVTGIRTNGTVLSSFPGKDTRSASFAFTNITTDIEMLVEFTYTSNRYVTADYATISNAVAVAVAYDTIYVEDGTYNLAEPVIVDKPLTLIGNTNAPGSVIVNAPGSGVDRDCFQVKAHGVTIRGFHLAGALDYNDPLSNGWLNAAIMVGNDTGYNQMAENTIYSGITNGLFRDNEITNCSHGAYWFDTTNCAAIYSAISGNTTGAWANATADGRWNWWGDITGPSGVGPGSGDAISSNVLYEPWLSDATGAHLVHYVGTGESLQDALNAASDGDYIMVAPGTYTEDLTVANTVTLIGSGFTLSGDIDFTAGATLTMNYQVTASNLTVGAGLAVTLQDADMVVDALVINAGGTLTVNNGTLIIDGLVLSGTFTLDDTWTMDLAVQGLPFEENFEFYTENSRLDKLGNWGWAASADTVIVQTNVVYEGTNAALLATGTAASNALSATAAERKIWSDWRIIPTMGEAPEDVPGADESLRLYFNTNGYVTIATNGGWIVCTQDVFGVSIDPVTNEWTRLTLHQDYNRKQAAVLLNGRVIRQEVPFLNATATNFTAMVYQNGHTSSNAYMDNVFIATNQPAGLGVDGDGDTMDDADELDTYGNTTNFHLPYVQVTIANVNSPGGDGGTVTPAGLTEFIPGSDTNYVISAYPAFLVTGITTNGTVVGSFPGKDTRSASFAFTNIVTDIDLLVEFTYTSNRYVTADYATITAAVAEAVAYDTIYVDDGTYNLAEPVIVDKPLTLIGNTNAPGSVIVNAPGSGVDRDCFQVKAHGVTIRGFHLAGALDYNDPLSNGWLNAAIMVGNDTGYNQMAENTIYSGITNGLFRDNEITNCSHGAYWFDTTNCAAIYSAISGNTTGAWANATADGRWNWWGDITGPSGVGPGSGDAISSNVLYEPWLSDATGAHLVHYVGTGESLQDALNAASDGDYIMVAPGTYTEDLTVANTVTLIGSGFTLSGDIDFTAGATLTMNYQVTASNLTVGAGLAVTLQDADMVVDALVINAGGTLTVNNGTLIIDGLVLSGTFTLDDTWTMSLVAQSLPFEDGFEEYYHGAQVDRLGYWGWAASSNTVMVQTNVVTEGTNAVILPVGTAVSNSIVTTAAEKRTWTDWYAIPTGGVAPEDAIGAEESLRFYVNTNGYIAIATNGGWDICTNDFFGVAVDRLSNEWTRLTLHHDYDSEKAAVLLNGRLLREEIPFIGASATNYTSVVLRNPHTRTNAYVDGIYIATNQPAGLDEDGDNDGMDDADELDSYGNTTNYHLPVVTVVATNANGTPPFGSVTPDGTFVMPSFGAETNFEMTANGGWVVTDVLTNGTTVGSFTGDDTASGAYTLSNVQSDVALTVEFTKLPIVTVVITNAAGGGTGGSVTPAGPVTMPSFAAVTNFVLSADLGWHVTDVLTNGTSVGAFTGDDTPSGSYTLAAIQSDMTLTVQFTYMLGLPLVAQELPFIDDFEDYTNGWSLTDLGYYGWAASSNGVEVQTHTVYQGTNAAVLPGTTSASNAITATPAERKIWSDWRILPTMGEAPDGTPGADESVRLYFNTNGYVAIATNGGWAVCTQDVFGVTVDAVTSGWYRLTMYQDYDRKEAAVLLNGRIIRQEVPFIGASATNFTAMIYQNGHISSNAYMDSVFIATNQPAGLDTDADGDGMHDADELDTYGNTTNFHLPLVTVVATNANGTPPFGSVTPDGTFEMPFSGAETNFAMTANGGWIVTDVLTNGTTVGSFTGEDTASGSYTLSNVQSDVTLTVEFSKLPIVTVVITNAAGGGTGGSVTPAGPVTMPSFAAVTNFVLSADLGWHVTDVLTNGTSVGAFTGDDTPSGSYTLAAIQSDMTLTVQFTYMLGLPLVAQGLPFIDDFEAYTNGWDLADLGYYSWAASSNTVEVQTNTVYEGTNAVLIATGTAASNAFFTTAAERRTWTDWYAIPTGGVAPEDAIGAEESLRFYVNTNGYIAIATNGGWDICTNDFFGVAVDRLSNEWARLTLHHDYNQQRAAVLLNGRLLREEIPFIGATPTAYTRVVFRNPHTRTNAYIDDIYIATNQPAGLDEDGDNDGMDDADELDTYGNTTNFDLPVITVEISNIGGPGGDGGSVAPSGAFPMAFGADTNFTVAADLGWLVTDVRSNGVSVSFTGDDTRSAGYAVSDIQADITLTVEFTYTVGRPLVARGLPFIDDFEDYTNGWKLADLGYFGWTSLSNGVMVQTNEVHGGTNAVIIPMGTTASNAIVTTVDERRIWSDWYIVPTPGEAPDDVPFGADESTRLYFNTNGHVTIATSTNATWDICTHDAFGQPVDGVSNEWVRLTLHEDYDLQRSAVLLNGRVLRASLPFIGDQATELTSIVYRNTSGPQLTEPDVYLDDVFISTNQPAGLIGDHDDDGMQDADELHNYSDLSTWPPKGTMFNIW